MKVNYVMKAWYKKILSLLICCLSATGYAQSAGWQETNSIDNKPARWYFGVEYGIPFLFGDLTTFSVDKPTWVIRSEVLLAIASITK